MTRALLVLLLVGISAGAEARRVVHIPTMRELCPGGAEWGKVAECIKRQGAFKLLRDEKTVKLVELPQQARIGGMYMFMHDGKSWQLRGEMHVYQDLDLLGFTRVTFGTHSGYRVEAGFAMSTSYSADGETSMPATLRQQYALVCFEDSFGCTQVMTSCDLLLHGKALFSFRGKLAYANKELRVVGDRGSAGNYCLQPELVLEDQ